MHRARVQNEIHSRPGIPGEEFGRQEITLQPITAGAGGDDVAGDVSAAVRQRVHVIQRREIEIQRRGAVNTPAAAVTHGSALDGALLVAWTHLLWPPHNAGGSRKADTVKMPTSGQCHLAKKGDTPRRE
jgi:hypothetical protein